MPQIVQDDITGLTHEFPDDVTPEEVEEALNKESSSFMRRALGDTGISLLQGAVGAAESAVGLLNIPTGGYAGKAMEDMFGANFQASRKFLEESKTSEQQQANRNVQEAEGFWDTVGAGIKNPSSIVGSIAESVASTIGAGGVGRGVVGLGRRFAPVVTEVLGTAAPAIAGAIGEGVISTGSAAEQIRQENDDRLLSPKQIALAIGSGATTSIIGILGGRMASKLGVGDIDALASGAVSSGAKKSILKRAADAVVSSGIEGLEELGQSANEKAAQNIALNKPWSEGVAEAAASGMLAGIGMGIGGGILHGSGSDAPTFDARADRVARNLQDPRYAQIYYGPAKVVAPEMPQGTRYGFEDLNDEELRELYRRSRIEYSNSPSSELGGSIKRIEFEIKQRTNPTPSQTVDIANLQEVTDAATLASIKETAAKDAEARAAADAAMGPPEAAAVEQPKVAPEMGIKPSVADLGLMTPDEAIQAGVDRGSYYVAVTDAFRNEKITESEYRLRAEIDPSKWPSVKAGDDVYVPRWNDSGKVMNVGYGWMDVLNKKGKITKQNADLELLSEWNKRREDEANILPVAQPPPPAAPPKAAAVEHDAELTDTSGKLKDGELGIGDGYGWVIDGYEFHGDVVEVGDGWRKIKLDNGNSVVKITFVDSEPKVAPEMGIKPSVTVEYMKEVGRLPLDTLADELHALGAGENTWISKHSPRDAQGFASNSLPSRQDLERLHGKRFTDTELSMLQQAYEDGRAIDFDAPPAAPPKAAAAEPTAEAGKPVVEPGQGGVPYYRKLGGYDAADPSRKRMRPVPQNFKLAYLDGWYEAKKAKPAAPGAAAQKPVVTSVPETVELNELRITKEQRGLGRLNLERLAELEAKEKAGTLDNPPAAPGATAQKMPWEKAQEVAKTFTPFTPEAKLTFPSRGVYQIDSPVAKIIGQVEGVYIRDKIDESAGSVFIVEATEHKKGGGTLVFKDAVRYLQSIGKTKVVLQGIHTEGGKALIAKMVRDGVIGKQIDKFDSATQVHDITKPDLKPTPPSATGSAAQKMAWEMTRDEYHNYNAESIISDYEGGGTERRGYGATEKLKPMSEAEKTDIRNDREFSDRNRRSTVEAALREGKPVPESVLADYPDLKPTPAATGATGAKMPWEMTQAEFVTKHKAIDAAWQEDKSKPSTSSFGKFYGKDYQEYLDSGKFGKETNYSTYEQQKHRSEVANALREGKPVPESVLADYPDLQREQVSRKIDLSRNAGTVDVIAKVRTDYGLTQQQLRDAHAAWRKKSGEVLVSDASSFEKFARDVVGGSPDAIDAINSIKPTPAATGAGEQVFWRVGPLPKGGKSFNTKDKFYEKGVSAYDSPFADSFAGSGKVANWYRLEGREIGRGSDGEPILEVTSSKKLSAAALAKERADWNLKNPLPDFQVGDKIFSNRVERMERGDGKLTITEKSRGGYTAVPTWEYGKNNAREYFISAVDRASLVEQKSPDLAPTPAATWAEARKMPWEMKVGDEQTIMQVPSVLADTKTIGGVRWDIFNGAKLSEKRAVVRTIDADSGEVLQLKQFPNYDAAETYYKTETGKAQKMEQPTAAETGAKIGVENPFSASIAAKSIRKDGGSSVVKEFEDLPNYVDAPKDVPLIPDGDLPQGTEYVLVDKRYHGNSRPSYAFTPDGLVYYYESGFFGISPWRLIGAIEGRINPRPAPEQPSPQPVTPATRNYVARPGQKVTVPSGSTVTMDFTTKPAPPAAPTAAKPNDRVFSEDYKGPRWTYGLRNRPMAIGAQPKGYIIGSDGPAVGRARNGTIQYPRELTSEELYDFEMELMESPKGEAKHPDVSKGEQSETPAAPVQTPSSQRQPFNPKEAKIQKKFLLSAIDQAVADAPDVQPEEIQRQWQASEPFKAKQTFDDWGKTNPYPTKPSRYNFGYDEAEVARYEETIKQFDATVVEWESRRTKEFSALADPYMREMVGGADVASALTQGTEVAFYRTLPHITIEVPGDGTFDILNTKDALRAFKERASKFPTTVAKASEPTTAREEAAKPPRVETNRTPESDLDAIAPIKTTDAQRYVLTFAFSDGKHLVATDGRRLAIVDRKGMGGTEKKPVLLDGNGKQPTDFGNDDKGKPLPPPNPPNWNQVIPLDSALTLRLKGIDTGRLFTLLKQAMAILPKEDAGRTRLVKLYVDSQGRIGITSKNANTGEYSHGVTDTSKFIGAFDGEYLLDGVVMARRLGSEKVDIYSQDDALSPAVIKGDGWKYVLMPIRSSDEETVEPPPKPTVRESKSDPGFYSRINRTVEDSPQGKATGAQWKALIRNSKLGFPQAEWDYRMLASPNALEDGSVYTKAEVLEYLRANEVVVKDVTLSGEDETIEWSNLDFEDGDNYKVTKGWQSSKVHPIQGVGEFAHVLIRERPNREGFYAMESSSDYRSGEQYLTDFETLDSAKEYIQENYKPISEGVDKPTHFSQYQLPGAKEGSYREVLLTVPKLEREYQGFDKTFTKLVPTKEPLWKDGHSDYSSIANPIVRLRFNERTTADGKRMLFLEEVQAPQKGEFEKMPALFQKNWREIAFKWALRHASENGFDLVGWTTGEQQAARYSLSKQVSEEGIRWSENPDKTIQLYAQRADTRGVLVNKAVELREVEDYAGKDVARQISEAVGRGVTQGAITGDRLDIGGEGLKRLYDVDFRNVVNSLPAVKKSGQKVGVQKVEFWKAVTHVDDFVEWAIRDRGYKDDSVTRKYLYDSWMKEEGEVFPLAKEWVDLIDSGKIPRLTAVHSISITPEIRESIMGGQAQFARGALVANPISEQAATQAVLDVLGVTELPENIRFINDPSPESNKGEATYIKGQLPQITINLAKHDTSDSIKDTLVHELLHPVQDNPALARAVGSVAALVQEADLLRKQAIGYDENETQIEATNELIRKFYQEHANSNIFQRAVTQVIIAAKRIFGIELTAKQASVILVQDAVKNHVAKAGGATRFSKYSETASQQDRQVPEGRVVTERNGIEDTAPGFSLGRHERDNGVTYAELKFEEAGIPTYRGNGDLLFVKKEARDVDHQVELDALLRLVKDTIRISNELGDYGSVFLQSVREMVAGQIAQEREGRGVMFTNRDVFNELANLSYSYFSNLGKRLSMMARNSSGGELLDILEGSVSLPERLRYEVLNGYFGGIDSDAIQKIIDVVKNQTGSDVLSDTDVAEFLKSLLLKVNRQYPGGTVYKLAHKRLSVKEADSLKKLLSKAKVQEAVQFIIELAKRNGVDEPPQKTKQLTPPEKLFAMVNEKHVDAINASLFEAIRQAERNAARAVWIKEESPDEDAIALYDSETEVAGTSDVGPTQEQVEAGLDDPKFAHWRVVRDSLLGYSPVTDKLIQKVIQWDIKGTDFSDPNAPKQVDSREIDLGKLSIAPDEEVDRVFQAYLDKLEEQMDLNGATQTTKDRIRASIQAKLDDQLAMVRAKKLNIFFNPVTRVASTATGKLGALINLGIDADARYKDSPSLNRLLQKIASKFASVEDMDELARKSRSEKFAAVRDAVEDALSEANISDTNTEFQAYARQVAFNHIATRLFNAESGIVRSVTDSKDVLFGPKAPKTKEEQARIRGDQLQALHDSIEAGVADTVTMDSLARKKLLNQLTPKLTELIKLLATLPISEQNAKADLFVATVMSELGVIDPANVDKVAGSLKRAFIRKLDAAKQSAVEAFLKEKITAVKKPGVLDGVRKLVNSGFFTDSRLSDPDFVSKVASKGAITRLLPNIKEIIKTVLATPVKNQKELGRVFADELAKKLGIDPSQVAGAAAAFAKAYKDKFEKARESSLKAAGNALYPKEREILFANNNKLWEKISDFVRSGGLDDNEFFREFARSKWGDKRVASDRDIAKLRDLVDQIEQLTQLTSKETLRAGSDPARIATAKKERARVQAHSIQLLQRRIEAMMKEWSSPTADNVLDWIKDPVLRRNRNAALNELASSNVLLGVAKFGRQLFDTLTFQPWYVGHRAISNTFNGFLSGVAGGANPSSIQLFKNLSSDLAGVLRVRIATIGHPLRAFSQAVKGRGLPTHVDNLKSGMLMAERLNIRAQELQDKGTPASIVRSYLMRFWALQTLGHRQFGAIDVLQAKSAEWQEMLSQVRAGLRAKGVSEIEINEQSDSIFSNISSDLITARDDAEAILTSATNTPSKSEINAQAWELLQTRLYARIKAIGLNADQFEERNAAYTSTIAWNRPPGGLGGIIAKNMKAVQKWAEPGMPLPTMMFGNAIGTSLNRGMTWIGMGLFPGMFKDDPWYETDVDKLHRKMEAITGVAMQTALGSLVLMGYIIVRLGWPKDKKEREEWQAKGIKPFTIEFPLGDGTNLAIPLRVGPLAPMAGGLAGAAAMRALIEKKHKEQQKLNDDASKLGVEPGKATPINAADLLAVAGKSAWEMLSSGRTASGMLGTYSDYGNMNVGRIVSALASPLIPLLPAYQELTRLAGINIDANIGSFWDMLVPSPWSPSKRVNMLGDSVATPGDLERILGIVTLGGGVTRDIKSDNTPYASLYQTGARPQAISRTKGYNFGVEIRPMTKSELAEFAVSRGVNLKSALADLGPIDGMSPADAKKAVQYAIRTSDNRALASMGITVKQASSRASSGIKTARRRSMRSTSARSSSPYSKKMKTFRHRSLRPSSYKRYNPRRSRGLSRSRNLATPLM